jgi:hypothetical protein
LILVRELFEREQGDGSYMKNPHEHIPFCQTRSAIAAACPACRWALQQWSQPLPELSFEKALTHEDEMFLTELAISF